jgi:hypothetical protein
VPPHQFLDHELDILPPRRIAAEQHVVVSRGEPSLRGVTHPKDHPAARIGKPARAAGPQDSLDRSFDYFFCGVLHLARDFTRYWLRERMNARPARKGDFGTRSRYPCPTTVVRSNRRRPADAAKGSLNSVIVKSNRKAVRAACPLHS